MEFYQAVLFFILLTICFAHITSIWHSKIFSKDTKILFTVLTSVVVGFLICFLAVSVGWWTLMLVILATLLSQAIYWNWDGTRSISDKE